MDPAGLAPALLGTNTNMLLYALRARIHFNCKTKGLLFQEIPFVWYLAARNANS